MTGTPGPGRLVKAGIVLAAVVAGVVVGAALGWAIVSGHGRCAAAATVTAVATVAAAWPAAAFTARRETEDRLARHDRQNPTSPHEPRRANPGRIS